MQDLFHNFAQEGANTYIATKFKSYMEQIQISRRQPHITFMEANLQGEGQSTPAPLK